MFSIYNEGKYVVAERFIRTLKKKIFKHMAAVSKNVYFDVLDDIVNKYNSTVHRTMAMKPVDVTSDFYAEYNEDSKQKDTEFKVGDLVRISSIKTFLLKDILQIDQKKFLSFPKLKILFRGLIILVT